MLGTQQRVNRHKTDRASTHIESGVGDTHYVKKSHRNKHNKNSGEPCEGKVKQAVSSGHLLGVGGGLSDQVTEAAG